MLTETRSRTLNLLGAIASFFSMIAAAVAVVNAVENRRQPKDEDLRVLGMDGETFHFH